MAPSSSEPIISERPDDSPLSRLTAAFFVSESAARWSSRSFFSAAVTFTDVPDEDFVPEELFDDELFEDDLYVDSFAALMSELCVTPVYFAISLRTACVSSSSPRSALLMSAAVMPLIFFASCSYVIPAPVRASLMSGPTLFALRSASVLCISALYHRGGALYRGFAGKVSRAGAPEWD